MYYPEEIIQEVRERSDIVTVISRYITLQKRGHNYFGLCPFHGEKTPSFSVNASDQYYHCFGCGVGGNVFTFLQNAENLSFVEAVEQLAAENGVTLPEAQVSPQEKARALRREQMLEANREAGRFYYTQLVANPQAQKARDYLDSRKVSSEYLKKFGLGYAPVARSALTDYLMKKGFSPELLSALYLSNGEPDHYYDRFFNRVMFPIFDVKGRVIAFGGRVIGKGEPKYLNSSDTELFNKRRNLYAMNLAKKSRRPQVLLAEGYMDVFSLHQAGFDNAVASLGTALTAEQAMLMRRYFENVCIVYDSDGAGTSAARRAIPILEQAGLKVRVIRVPGSKDPDEFIKANGAQAFQQLIDTALDPVAFELAVSDTSTVEGQVATMKTMRERLVNMEDDAEREIHIRDVAERVHVDPAILRKQVEEERRIQGVKEYQQARAVYSSSRKKEGALVKADRELLAVMLKYPESRAVIFRYLSPDDFLGGNGVQEAASAQTDGYAQAEAVPQQGKGLTQSGAAQTAAEETALQAYRDAAVYLIQHPGTPVLLGDLISLAEDPAAQQRLSELSSVIVSETREDVCKQTCEIVRSIRAQRLDEALRSCSDPSEMQQIIRKKKENEHLSLQF